MISIAVIARNESENITRCLQSVLKSVSGLEFEIILVDNNSSDDTVGQASRCLRSVPHQIIKLDSNNIAKARNVALLASKNEFLCFVDADCAVKATWLSSLLAGIHHYPQAAAVGGSNKPPPLNSFYFLIRGLSKSVLGHFQSSQMKLSKSPEKVRHLSTTNVLYRRKIVLDVGGFNELFDHVGEDLELSYRLRGAGYELIHLPYCEVFHFHKPHFQDWFAKMMKYGFAQPIVFFANPKQFQLYRLLPLFLLTIFCHFLFWYPAYAGMMALMYLTFLLAEASRVSFLNREINVVTFAGLMMGSHIFYGLGQIKGLGYFLRKCAQTNQNKVQRQSRSISHYHPRVTN